MAYPLPKVPVAFENRLSVATSRNTHQLKLLLSALALPTLSACCTLPANSPPPPMNGLANCAKAAGEFTHLAVGQRCMAIVQAKDPLNIAKVAVRPGQRYRLTLPEGQMWQDLNRSSDPRSGDEGSALMNLVANPAWFFTLAALLLSRNRANA